MATRKWEDLPVDCLVKIFGRVGMESLLLDVPFVCKSWYEATLNPSCWERLDFPEIEDDPYYGVDSDFVLRFMDVCRTEGHFSITALVKIVVNRSGQYANWLRLTSCCTYEALAYIGDKCPALKFLVFRGGLSYNFSLKFPELISKWKNLELLSLRSKLNLREILSQISIHCKNFVALGVTQALIGEDEATAIITLLPNLKYLFITGAHIEREYLVMILNSCKELVHLDARKCIGFEENDDEIVKLASHVKTFKSEGSTTYDACCWDWDPPNYRDDGFHDGNCSD